MYLQHWDNPAPIGKSLRASMEYLQLEIGCTGCPLHEPYQVMGDHCTHSWVRSFWECVDLYKLQLDVEYQTTPAPRENDMPIMALASKQGYKGTKLESVNRCRIYTKSLFLRMWQTQQETGSTQREAVVRRTIRMPTAALTPTRRPPS